MFQSAYQRHGEWKRLGNYAVFFKHLGFNPLISGMGNGSLHNVGNDYRPADYSFQSAYQRHGEWKIVVRSDLTKAVAESFNPLISGMGNGSSTATLLYDLTFMFQSAYQRHGEWKLPAPDDRREIIEVFQSAYQRHGEWKLFIATRYVEE